jgi:UDP-N-acetylglucosamine acyltransferase
MPGVLMLEALAQAAALLRFDRWACELDDESVYYFAGIDGARFKRPVEPGDQLVLEVELERVKARHLQVQCGRAHGRRRDGRAEAELHVHDARDRPEATRSLEHDAIHPTAIVDPQRRARPRRSRSGPYAVIGPRVRVGAGHAHRRALRDRGRTTIGRDNRIFQFCLASARAPQDKKYARRAHAAGDRRRATRSASSARFNRGTVQDGGVTRIGNDNWIMAYVHVAHDCRVGSHTILANNVTLAGHVHDRRLGDRRRAAPASTSSCEIGAHAMIGFAGRVAQDVPPFVVAERRRRQGARAIDRDGPQAARLLAPRRIAAIRNGRTRRCTAPGQTLEQAQRRDQQLAQHRRRRRPVRHRHDAVAHHQRRPPRGLARRPPRR